MRHAALTFSLVSLAALPVVAGCGLSFGQKTADDGSTTTVIRIIDHSLRPRARPKAGFDGVWKTVWGDVKISQHGNALVGRYRDGAGRIHGKVKGRTFAGKWWEHVPRASYERAPRDRRGEVTFTLSADGAGLAGKWRRDSDGPSGARAEWKATRKSAPPGE